MKAKFALSAILAFLTFPIGWDKVSPGQQTESIAQKLWSKMQRQPISTSILS
jgi:hypothetical protein